MTSVHTIPPEKKPDPSNYNKGDIFVSPRSEETFNSVPTGSYDEEEKVIVDPNSDSGKKPEGFFISKKFIKIGGAVLAGIVALSVGAVMINNKRTEAIATPTSIDDNKNPSNEAESSQIAITSTELTSEATQATDTKETAEASTENIDYTKTVYNIVEGYSFESLTAEQQSEIKKYEFMPKEEFQALPQEEQAILGYWVLENYGPRFDVILENSNVDLYYTNDPQTAEEILGNYAYLTSMCCTLVELNEDGNGAHTNVELGEKVLGSIRDTATKNHIESIDGWVEQTGGNLGVFDIDMKVTKYKKNGDGSIIINNTWETTDTVTVLPSAEFSQKTFIPFGATNIYGEKVNIYLRSLAVDKDDPQYIDIG